MLALVLLGQEDSTGQRITFIVIGLLLAALMLAILTAWYYRVTDPGPGPGQRTSGKGGSRGGGAPRGGPDPSPGPGWRKRLSGLAVPAQTRQAKPSGSTQTPAPSQPREPETQVRAERAAKAPVAPDRTVSPASPQAEPSPDKSPDPSDDRVSLEGGHYLDLTDAPSFVEPNTNVGSLNSLDLRQPAPLVDPTEQASVPVSAVSESDEGGLSFDEWLAEVEASED